MSIHWCQYPEHDVNWVLCKNPRIAYVFIPFFLNFVRPFDSSQTLFLRARRFYDLKILLKFRGGFIIFFIILVNKFIEIVRYICIMVILLQKGLLTLQHYLSSPFSFSILQFKIFSKSERKLNNICSNTFTIYDFKLDICLYLLSNILPVIFPTPRLGDRSINCLFTAVMRSVLERYNEKH
jgi:hypothetical protein